MGLVHRAPPRSRPVAAVLLVTLAASCAKDEPANHRQPPPVNRPPLAVALASPPVGVAPMEVLLDASQSTDADEPTAALSARWDVDGDGAWDTPVAAATTVVPHTYASEGSYTAVVEIRDSAGAVATAAVTQAIRVYPPGTIFADLAADSDRDGSITLADDAGEELWSSSRGATLLVNWDDDDGDGVRDGNDDDLDGTDDLDDLGLVVARRMESLTPGHAVTVEVTPAGAATHLRIFANSGGALALVHAPGDGVAPLDATTLGEQDVELRLEVVTGRSATWDGTVQLRLVVRAGSTVVAEDEVALRAAPVVFSDNTRPAEAFYVMRIEDTNNGPNDAFYDAVVEHLPASVSLHDADEYVYEADRWVQDCMQPGYQAVPVSGGVRVVPTYLEAYRHRSSSSRPEGLEDYLTAELVGPELGYVYPCINGTCADSSLNYGGNIEVAPPHDGPDGDFPLGRLVIGGGDEGTVYGGGSSHDHMAADQRSWLEAQGVQAPLLEVSSEWLAVGHIDEFFMFVPDLNLGNGRPWKVVLASPALARAALQTTSNQGGGTLPVFFDRDTETRVDEILDDTDLMDFNDHVQARIDSVRQILKDRLGLVDADFVEVPVLYENYSEPWGGATDMAVAYNPGLTNLIVLDDIFFVPDPEGPRATGGDPWKLQTTAALAPLGVEVVYVDVFDSYHLLMGEAHCGANVAGGAYDAGWWQL